MAPSTRVLDRAAHVVGVHNLRAYDAVHLASACATSAAVPEGAAFAASDKTLRAAAAAQGLDLLPD